MLPFLIDKSYLYDSYIWLDTNENQISSSSKQSLLFYWSGACPYDISTKLSFVRMAMRLYYTLRKQKFIQFQLGWWRTMRNREKTMILLLKNWIYIYSQKLKYSRIDISYNINLRSFEFIIWRKRCSYLIWIFKLKITSILKWTVFFTMFLSRFKMKLTGYFSNDPKIRLIRDLKYFLGTSSHFQHLFTIKFSLY